MKLQVGMDSPDFTLLDNQEMEYTLSSYKGQNIVLYFYPKDDTPGCTVEACSFRDDYSEYEKVNAVILGVSVDNSKSHQKFIDKFELPFKLLADTEKVVVKMYDVWGLKKNFGREYEGIFRTTFIINKKGKISHIFEKVKPDVHSDQVLLALNQLSD